MKATGADQALDVIWHDVECGSYTTDLPVWRTLADACGGPVLDVGAGTGRVSLDLASRGAEITALDIDEDLLAALRSRARRTGLEIQTAHGDACSLDLGRKFALIIVPMQTIQLLDGRQGRRAFMRAASQHLSARGLLAMAVADSLSAFDGEADGLPSPDETTVDSVRYRSQTMALTDQGEQAVIHRLRTIGERDPGVSHSIALHHLAPDDLQTEALMLGFKRKPMQQIPETLDYVGATVVTVGV